MRAKRMDQTELGKRVGVSRTTISAIERGMGVNAKALFDVLAFLDLTDVIRVAISQQLQIEDKGPLRKLRKVREELSSDF
ncbi:MAG: helix-turn-helix domain-containing protein [Paraglaciecola sp.]|nr:helix-turn-helix domain-containing protein [Paraglaciecola sp.]